MSLCNNSAPFSPYILRSLWLKENDQLLGVSFYKALEGNTIVPASLSATASTHHYHQ